MSFSTSLASTLFILLLMIQPAFSHGFHYEVQIKSELQINTDEKISGLGMTWLYDPIVSAAMLKEEPEVKKLEKSILSNLERLNFFTKIKSEETVLETSKVQNFTLAEIKKADVVNLQIRFTLPIAKPPKLTAIKQLTLDFADPTATAILYYEKPEDLTLGFGLQELCKTSVSEKESFKEGEFPQIVTITCN